MVQEVLLNLSIIIIVSAVLAVIARIIKQPPIIAYLIAGVVVGPLFLNITASSSEFIQVFAHIGVAFLLFIVGLSLDLRVLKEIGVVSTFAGIAEIIVVGGIGFLISAGLGMGSTTALYIGAALAFSSTVVVVKILSDKKEIDTLHGRIALGILIIQDFAAAIALMAIPLLNSGASQLSVLISFSEVIGIIAAIFLFSAFALNKFMNYLARSQESLFLFGIAWALALAVLFDRLGFSLEIGALIAGMSLASSKYTLELGSKIKPLRDFFVVLFFVFFGTQLAGQIGWDLVRISLLFSALIIIVKPVIVMTILRIFGYKKKTNFLAGTSLAQISEFSLILILMGYTLGHLSQDIMSMAVLIAIFTIGASSYGIYYSHALFDKLSKILGIFEGRRYMKKEAFKEKYDVILFGYHRIGYKLLNALKETKLSFAVVDHNPNVILSLGKEGINCIYGDASDKGFLSELELENVRLAISTVPDENTNLSIRERLNETGSKAIFIATAEQPRRAFELYEKGVDYVIVPHHLGGEYASEMIKSFCLNAAKYRDAGRKHLKELLKAKKSSRFELM
ncbi:MAG TPA: cation:proton antiporter [Candidatus Nanoarchaeia archaeon]|nr:cation:proton antiporter [Candidatus Nanoarchaeia archaeon]